MKAQVFVNGIPQHQISVSDRGLQFGDGLFETIAVINGKPCRLNQHLKRLEKGLNVLQIENVNLEQLASFLKSKLTLSDTGIAKIIVTRGSGSEGYRPVEDLAANIIVYLKPYDKFIHRDKLQPVNICHCKTPISVNRLTAGFKHLNRIDQVMATLECQNKGFDDGLLGLDDEIIEATSSNLFLWKDSSLYTPDLHQAGIAGIARESVLQIAKEKNIQCIIDKISIEQCHKADALFLTNSITPVKPVLKLEHTDYSKQAWPTHLYQEIIDHVYS